MSIFDDAEILEDRLYHATPIDVKFIKSLGFVECDRASIPKLKFSLDRKNYHVHIYPSIFDMKHWVIRLEHIGVQSEVYTLKNRGMLIDALDKIKFDE